MTSSPAQHSAPRARAGAVTAAELDALVSVARTLVAISAHSVGTESSLDVNQVRVLVIVASLGSASLSEVAHAAQMHVSTASRQCDRLVSEGLLHRAEAPADRRQLALTITDLGNEVVRRVAEARRESLRTLLAKLPEGRRSRLVSVLDDVVQAGGEPAAPDLWAMGWTTERQRDREPASTRSQ